jgi:hypothetical protein
MDKYSSALIGRAGASSRLSNPSPPPENKNYILKYNLNSSNPNQCWQQGDVAFTAATNKFEKTNVMNIGNK